MVKLHLVVGNKRYSSWSLRGYLAVKWAGLDFDETVIPLFTETTHQQMKALAPKAPRRVPFLIEGDHVVWDTYAVMEYAAENSQAGDLWPPDKFARAHARSVAAEMHSGFFALRDYIPMNLSRSEPYETLPDAVSADIDRILDIWTNCRDIYGKSGPYLFGKLSLADAAYAPVVARLKSRSVPVSASCQSYMDTIWEDPAFVEWRQEAEQEEWVIEQ